MNKEEKTDALREKAAALFSSWRGQYIISQALYKAIKVMEKVEPPVMRELSNIEDMKLIMEGLFPMFMSIAMAEEAMAEEGVVGPEFWKRMDIVQSNIQPGKEEA
jgi:hypothetical protein|tara:strand:+ start:43 stop:357 length:315 start_codon:yes stop_codon:yes gene_type:complete